MNSIQSALREALGADRLEKIGKQVDFERTVERGEQLLTQTSSLIRRGELRQALRTIALDRFACAAATAKQLTKDRRKFVPVNGNGLCGFSELEAMERLIKAEIAQRQPAGNEIQLVAS